VTPLGVAWHTVLPETPLTDDRQRQTLPLPLQHTVAEDVVSGKMAVWAKLFPETAFAPGHEAARGAGMANHVTPRSN